MKTWCVHIQYIGTSNYIVKAETSDEAIEKAKEEYANGETPPLLGNEYEEIEHIAPPEELPADSTVGYVSDANND